MGIVSAKNLLVPALLLIAMSAAAPAQDREVVTELDPGIAIAVDLNPRVRLDFFTGKEKSEEIATSKWKVSAGASFRLKPLFESFLDDLDTNKQHVLVLGAGPIGCFAAGVARAAGAALVVASDYNPTRRELAARMGAHVTLDPATDDVVERVKALTDGDGVDLVCEMSGHPSGHATAFAAARLGGRVNLLGTPSRTTEVDFARDIIFKGLTLYGVTGRKMYETWHQMRRLLQAGRLDPCPVITHRFPLDGIADAIQVLKDGQAGKVILEIGP